MTQLNRFFKKKRASRRGHQGAAAPDECWLKMSISFLGGKESRKRFFWKLKCSWKSSVQRMKHESWLKKNTKIKGQSVWTLFWLMVGHWEWFLSILRTWESLSAGSQMSISMFGVSASKSHHTPKKKNEATSRCFRRNLGRHRCVPATDSFGWIGWKGSTTRIYRKIL